MSPIPHVLGVSCVLTSNDQTKTVSRCWVEKKIVKKDSRQFSYSVLNMSSRLQQLFRRCTLHVTNPTNAYEDNCKPRLELASIDRTWWTGIKESQLGFRIYRIETWAPCYKCENETYSGDESGEAEAGLLSAQSENKINVKFTEH